MASPAEKLAESLQVLQALQEKGIVAIKSDSLSRIHRQRLLTNGFIREVYKGWYMIVPPAEAKGDSTSWYSSFWPFCSQVLNDMYGQNWCISPEQSLMLHAGNRAVPQQLIVKSPDASNNKTVLPHNTSLFHIKSELPAGNVIVDSDGLRMYSLAASLVQASPGIFTRHPAEVRTALSMIDDASDLLSLLLEGGHSIIAGRLAGAFQNNKQVKIADTILKTMGKVGYAVRATDPFGHPFPILLPERERSPYGNRIRILWAQMRNKVIDVFPPAPGIPADKESYLKSVEKIYVTDAYHSLSIEQYKVTPDLIERVRNGNWDATDNEADRKQRDAMAAKGYWDAFQAVEKSILQLFQGRNAGDVANNEHGDWYRELFGPSVSAGLVKAADLSGYRNHQVYIGQSKHVPMNRDAVRDAMPVLFELLKHEPEASVRAVLGHFIFVYVHPYMDGNGRMGRFLMNAMFASGGYPWTVIPVEERHNYMQALETASVEADIEPFARFIAFLVKADMEGTPVARLSEPVKPEFPPYRFYQRDGSSKKETWTIPVDEKFSILRLASIELDPISARPGLILEIDVEAYPDKRIMKFNLSTDMFYNPKLGDILFFAETAYIDKALPPGKKNIRFRIICPPDQPPFELSLKCEYR